MKRKRRIRLTDRVEKKVSRRDVLKVASLLPFLPLDFPTEELVGKATELTAETGTGTKSYTLSKFSGVTPKAVIFFTISKTGTTPATQTDVFIGMGAASSIISCTHFRGKIRDAIRQVERE